MSMVLQVRYLCMAKIFHHGESKLSNCAMELYDGAFDERPVTWWMLMISVGNRVWRLFEFIEIFAAV